MEFIMNKLIKILKYTLSLVLIVNYTQTMQKTPSTQGKVAGTSIGQRIALQQEYNKLSAVKNRNAEQEARIQELRNELTKSSNIIRFRSKGL